MKKQQGFVLPVGMILLAIMSVIGVSTLRDSALQERMASNFIDKEKSFQAAESALSVVQRVQIRQSYEAISGTPDFVATVENPAAAPDYQNLDVDTVGWVVSSVSGSHVYTKPRALIEEVQNTDSLKVGKREKNKELAQRYYRITTFARGDTDTSETMLQGVVVQK